jgi:hypothetical protein
MQLIKLYNRISKTLCKRLIESYDERIRQISTCGGRFTKNQKKKFSIKRKKIPKRWKISWNNNDFIERVVYNNKTLEKARGKSIKFLEKQMKSIEKFYHKNILPKIKIVKNKNIRNKEKL